VGTGQAGGPQGWGRRGSSWRWLQGKAWQLGPVSLPWPGAEQVGGAPGQPQGPPWGKSQSRPGCRPRGGQLGRAHGWAGQGSGELKIGSAVASMEHGLKALGD